MLRERHRPATRLAALAVALFLLPGRGLAAEASAEATPATAATEAAEEEGEVVAEGVSDPPPAPPAGAAGEEGASPVPPAAPVANEQGEVGPPSAAAPTVADAPREAAPATAPASKGGPVLPATEVTERPGSALGTAAAVFPGLLLPGVGHFVAGESGAGKRFLVLDAVGLALIGLGFGGQAASGGAAPLSPLTLTPAVAGISLLSVAWLADVLGAAHGTSAWLAPREPPGTLALSVGYTGLFGSQLSFHHGVGLEARWRLGDFTAEPWGQLDPSMSYYGAGARLGLVLWRDGEDPVTRLSLAGAFTHHRFRFDRYSTTVGELHGELRLNLRHLSPTLRNVWMLVRLGAGLEGFAYDAAAFDWADLSPVLVLEVGGGARVAERVTVEFLYRSRKDELPGGIVIPGLFDSYFGFFEASGRVTLTERFALRAGARYGNGLMPWISFESQLF